MIIEFARLPRSRSGGRRTEGERPRPRRPAPFIETLGRAPESAGGNDAMQSGGLGQSRLYCAHSLVAVGHSLDRQRPRKGFPTQQSVSAFPSFLQNDPPLFQNLGPFISPNTVSVCAILGKWLARPASLSLFMRPSLTYGCLSVRCPGAQDGLLPSSLPLSQCRGRACRGALVAYARRPSAVQAG